jgi:uncharacterized membrane protein
MPMKTHELHPALVHAPLVLLPLAAGTDLAALVWQKRAQRRALERSGRRLWLGVAGSAALAGVAGMAASQQVRPERRQASDMMFVHGIGNAALLAAATGISLWRLRRPPTVVSTSLALLGVMASGYTAYLGGELVYAHGMGVDGNGSGPALLSRAAPGALIRDALRGAAWLGRRARQWIGGERALELGTTARGLLAG